MSQSAIDQTIDETLECSRLPLEAVAQMMSDLFATMLGMHFDATPREQYHPTSTSIQATIQIEGDWKSQFRAIVSSELAHHIAGAMFGLSDNEVSKSDVFDAMGEIINVIGGNAKGYIDGDCQLSLPCVAGYVEPTQPPALVATFECAGQPIMIQLFETSN